MNKDERIITSGPFKGKKIVFAPTTGVDMFPEIMEDFMKRILGFEPEEYLITDESSLLILQAWMRWIWRTSKKELGTFMMWMFPILNPETY